MSSLFIVESPGKVEKIQHILDDLYPHEFVVRASVGHVCDLPNHEIGFSYPALKLRPENSTSKAKSLLIKVAVSWSRLISDTFILKLLVYDSIITLI